MQRTSCKPPGTNPQISDDVPAAHPISVTAELLGRAAAIRGGMPRKGRNDRGVHRSAKMFRLFEPNRLIPGADAGHHLWVQPQPALMPAASMIGHHFSISAFWNLAR